MTDFPVLSDIRFPVAPPFEVTVDGAWWAVGVGDRGLILEAEETKGLFWIAQVVKFCPQSEYLPDETISRLLKDRGVSVDWRGR